MMRRTTAGLTLGAFSALFALACSTEGPTTGLRSVSAEADAFPTAGGTQPRTPEGEYLEVCKDYVNQPGTTPPASTNFSLAGPGISGSVAFSLAPGACNEVFSMGGTDKVYTVTETVPDGYTASYVVSTFVDGVVSAGSSTSGNVADGTLAGVGGLGGKGALIVFTNTEEVNTGGCTLTQGYWKTHSVYGPAAHPDAIWNDASIGGPDAAFYFSGSSWLTLFKTPPKGGNVYIQLAHQYMAARLNLVNGATPTAAVTTAINGATAFFNNAANTPNTTLSKSLSQTLKGYATTLGAFNEGTIGPGHC